MHDCGRISDTGMAAIQHGGVNEMAQDARIGRSQRGYCPVPPFEDYGYHHGRSVLARIQAKGWSTSVTYPKGSKTLVKTDRKVAALQKLYPRPCRRFTQPHPHLRRPS